MTLYEFKILDFNNKCQAVWNNGIYVDAAITQTHRINLYAIDKFFVEIYYNPKINKIEDVQSFKHGHSLDKYSGTIPL